MFDGKIFFPVTGIPILKIDCISIVLADADPVPFTVPILSAKLLTEDRGPKSETARVVIVRLHRPFRSSGFGLRSQRMHTESPVQTSSYPTPQSGTVRRRVRSA